MADASVKELQERREVAQRTKKQTDTALKNLAKVDHVPDGAKGEKKDFREALKDSLAHQKQRIKELTERIKKKKEGQGGAAAAVKWALSQVGVTEKPYGSNWGVPVQDWIKYTGYGSPVPWCGCFVAVAAVRQGGADIAARIRLGYVGYIVSDARAGNNGLRAVPFDQAQPGDILALWGDQHTELVVAKPSGDSIQTVGGNTSAGTSGSQNNGGGVYKRTRYRGDVTVVARPDY